MKPESIEAKQRRRKREAVRGVVLFTLLQTACVVGFAALCGIPGLPRWLFWIFAVLAILCVIPVLAAIAALRQRFREIEGGDVDAAGQY